MREFLNSLSNPSWWASAVVLSLIINLASSYLKGPLDRFFAWLPARRQARSQRNMELMNAAIDAARSPDGLRCFIAAEARARVLALLFSVAMLVSMSVSIGLVNIQQGSSRANATAASPASGASVPSIGGDALNPRFVVAFVLLTAAAALISSLLTMYYFKRAAKFEDVIRQSTHHRLQSIIDEL